MTITPIIRASIRGLIAICQALCQSLYLLYPISFYQPPIEIGAFLLSILLMKKPRHTDMNNLPKASKEPIREPELNTWSDFKQNINFLTVLYFEPVSHF